jgi:hypothetical protein
MKTIGMLGMAGVIACACWLMVPATAVAEPAATTQESAAIHRSSSLYAWPAETITGTIMMVDPAARLLVVEGPDRVPFDMQVDPGTRIVSGNQRLSLRDLSVKTNDTVSVRFVPEARGDVARSIRVG